MKNPALLLLLCAGLWLASCQSHRREEANRATATLNIMNQVAAMDIAREKNGDPPPGRFATWPAYWQHHFATLRFTPTNRERGNGGLGNLAGPHRVFVQQQRAAAGLPPFE